MTLEHLGIASADAAATLATLERLFGLTAYKSETVEREGVRTHFVDTGARLELLEALSPDSPVARFLEIRGEGVHHLAFRVADVDAAVVRLREVGVPLLADAPRPGADGKRIVFLHPKATPGLLVELLSDNPDALPEPDWADTPAGRLAAYRFGRPADTPGTKGCTERGRPSILVLHGAAGSTRLETLLLARLLEPAGHVIALDLPGHGRSSGDGDVTFESTMEAVVGAMDALGLDRPHVVGYSFGGAVALVLAATHPERVGRLAVHATNLAWDDETVAGMTRRLRADAMQRRYPDLWARFEAAHEGRTRDVFDRVAAFSGTIPAFAPRAADLLTRVSAPTLVTAGDRDELFALDRTLALHAALPGASLGVLPGVRHAITPEATRTLAPLVAAHLAG